MIRRYLSVCNLVLLTFAASGADGTVPTGIEITPAFLRGLTEEARTHHPALKAASRRHQAALRGVDAVRTWSDPNLRVGGVVANTPGPDLDTEGDLLYAVEQPLPLFGKAGAERREANAGAAVADARATAEFHRIRASLVQSVYRLALLDESIRIGTEDLRLLDRWTSIARERQRAGLDSVLDLLRLENESDKRRQALDTDRRQRGVEQTQLNRLLARAPDDSWPDLVLPPVAPPVELSEELFSLAARAEPQLNVLRLERERANAGVDSTRRKRKPELNLGVEARHWSGSGDFREATLTLGLNLPWFNRSHYRADLDRDQALADASQADVEDYELEVRRDVLELWTRIDASRREAILYRDSILPRSVLATDTATATWAAGKGMFIDVHETRRMLLEARRALAVARADQLQSIAGLSARLAVEDLDSIPVSSPRNGEVTARPASR